MKVMANRSKGISNAARHVCRVVLSAFLTFGVAGVASAQIPDVDPSADARIHLGQLAMTPAVVCSAGYDTNPYREPGRTSTFEMYTIPQVEGWLTGAANRASFWGAAEMVRFSNMVGAQNWQVGGKYERIGPSIRPYASYNLRNTNANPTGFEVGHKSMRIEGDLVAGADARFGRFSLGGAFRTTKTNWAADALYLGSSLREKLNRRSNATRAGLGFSLTPLTTLEVAAERTTDRFVFSPDRDGDGSLVLAGISLASPAIVQGNAWFGYRQFHSLSSSTADFHGAVGFGTLVYARPSGGFLAARFQRDMQFSFDTSLAYYLSNAYTLTAILPLSTRWRLQGFGATTTLDYRAAGSNLSGPLERVNEYGGSVGFNIGTVSVVGVTVERGNAVGPQGWKETRVVAFLTYGSANGKYQRLDRPIPFSR